MPLDPVIKGFLDAANATGRPPIWESPLDVGRAAYATYMSLAGPGPDMKSVEDRTLGGVPVRIYRPHHIDAVSAPALVWVHGGGWTIGSVDTDDCRVRTLAERAGVVVLSVEYRLAPEHPFPAAFDDAYAVVTAAAATSAELRIDVGRIAVGGDSAGGNLAAAVALWARDHDGPSIAFQLLVYPAVDGPDSGYASLAENGIGYFLTLDSMRWFTANYEPPGTVVDERVEPMRAKTLAGLPPAHVITAEFDPLRDEGTAYANRLRADGVPTTHINYEGCIHGFFGMEALFPVAKVAMDDAAAALRAGLPVPA